MSDKYAALKQAAAKATPGEWCTGEHHEVIADAGLNANYYVASCSGPDHRANTRFIAAASPATILELLAERDADRARIAELSASHNKLRDTMAAIHNTIRMDGGYTPLAAILNASKRAHEESAAAAAGISLKIEGE